MALADKLSINLKDIKNIKQVWIVLLIVIEVSLGSWLLLATDSGERIAAGLVMVASLWLFLHYVTKSESTAATNPKIVGFDQEIKPAKREVSQAEIEATSSQKVVGAKGTFRINTPPEDWDVKLLSIPELALANMEIEDDPEIMKQFALPENVDITTTFIQSPNTLSLIPIPGETLINGNKIPTALETIVKAQLTIIPFEKIMEDSLTETTLAQNMISFTTGVLNSGLLKFNTIENGTLKETGKEFIQFNLQQKLNYMMANDKKVDEVEINMTIFGIEGTLIDHIFLIRYPTFGKEKQDAFEKDREILMHLVDSFEPLRAIDLERKKAEAKSRAEANYQAQINQYGKQYFYREIVFLTKKYKNIDLESLEQRSRLLKILRPFEKFASQVGLDDEPNLNILWECMRKAEKGDAKDFNTFFTQMIAGAENTLSESEENPETAHDGQ